jgi:serine protease Do
LWSNFFSVISGNGRIGKNSETNSPIIESRRLEDRPVHSLMILSLFSSVLCVFGDLPAGSVPAQIGRSCQVAECEGIEPDDALSRKLTSEKIVPDDSVRTKSARDEMSKTQARIDEVLKKALPATVRFHLDGSSFSGVIVTEDGYIATCAHHFQLPGTEITVELADGRKVKGEVLGSHRYWDIGLIKIRDSGKWPHVPFGKSASMKREDLCIALGYPADSNRPDWEKISEVKARIGRVIYSAAPGVLQTSCLIQGGDSGGPLLDMEGRLIGIHRSVGALHFAGSTHAGAELFEDLWDELVAGKRVELVPRGLGRTNEIYRQAIGGSSSITVDILCDNRPALLGTIVDPEGWIVTKASDLNGRITCRLFDGREYEATRYGVSRQFDLAMLKIDAKDLPGIVWSRSGEPPMGTLVAAAGCRTKWSLSIVDGKVQPIAEAVPPADATIAAGVVSHIGRQIMPMRGWPPFSSRITDQGLVVTEVSKSVEIPVKLRVDDLVTHIDGEPVNTNAAFEEMLEAHQLAGDRIMLSIRRDGQSMELQVPLNPMTPKGSTFPLSPRRTGFPRVFSTDLDLRPEMCGGPLIDMSGEVVGINIARESGIESYAIPVDTVRGLIDELRSRPKDKSQ